MIGSVQTKAHAAALGGRIQAELEKDERILSADVVVVATTNGPGTAFEISVDAETSAGPFTLVLAASAVTVELVGLTVEG